MPIINRQQIGMDTILDKIENTYKNHNYCSLCTYRVTCYKSYLM